MTDSTQEHRQHAERVAFYNRMKAAGVPPRFLRAHIGTNCQVYADHAEKERPLIRANQLLTDGYVTQDGADRFALLLLGEYGTGKTWLGTALFKGLMARNYTDDDTPNGGMWRKFYDFIREVQATYSPGASETSHAVVQRFQRTPVLMLDDVGDLERSNETEDRRRLLYEVLDYRNDYFLPTVITTNLGPDELTKQFGERAFQRIREMAALVSMRGVNFRTNPITPDSSTNSN